MESIIRINNTNKFGLEIYQYMLYNNSAFEKCLGVAQFGSALEWGSRGRRFDSCHSDQKETTIFDRKLSFLFVLFTLHFFRSSLLSEIVASIEKIKEKK